MNIQNHKIFNEPYRLMFPLGTLFLLIGIFLWLPMLWTQDNYPVLAHRTLVLNGFMAMFVGGFLMTSVPKFSRTHMAKSYESILYILTTILVITISFFIEEKYVLWLSTLQGVQIFFFAFRRFKIMTATPPFTFIFIFVGFMLWMISGLSLNWFSEIPSVSLQYDGAILAFILGIGSKLIPGILGHPDTLSKPLSKKPGYLNSIPLYFYFLMLGYFSSFFLPIFYANWLRFSVVIFIAIKFWKVHRIPLIKSSLTYSMWASSVLIVLSVLLKALWTEGFIHAGHAFFINGVVLLSLLVATRVLQAHGPINRALENSPWLYIITFLIVLASATRVSAFLMPDSYYRHLAYSSFCLGVGIIIWSFKYLKYVSVYPKGNILNGAK